ncbi:PIG-L family deacetylase [Streptomyces sp. NPDC056670]|uniref:PIG-L deacetylase family protein n=1 Tax=Streptomyces sp. NPDC056670 TaxID=3345904 RepID=UPI003688AF22
MTGWTPGSSADPIQAPGPPERVWRAWSGLERLPAAALPLDGRIVIVAAHPDDEVLGAGGTIARLAAAGARLTVVSVTDGEASHPHSSRVTPAQLAAIRAKELREALTALGAPDADVVRLRVADTRVGAHEDEGAVAIEPLLKGAQLCLAPWTGDVHSDHEAAGRAALAAARAAAVDCWMYPVWMWHWARPDDVRVPWDRAVAVALADRIPEPKRKSVGCFVSQIHPLGPGEADAAILPPDELAHHLRDIEVFFT